MEVVLGLRLHRKVSAVPLRRFTATGTLARAEGLRTRDAERD
jgi:hypothetical protein